MENSGSAFVVSQFQSFLVLLIEKITTKTKQAVPKQNPAKRTGSAESQENRVAGIEGTSGNRPPRAGSPEAQDPTQELDIAGEGDSKTTGKPSPVTSPGFQGFPILSPHETIP